MTLIDLGPIPAEPVTLAEVKAWCRIERGDEDELLAGLVRAARETIEADTRLMLVRRGFRLSVDPVPGDGWIEIARHPLAAVTEVVAYDIAGTPATFPAGDAVIERAVGIEAIRVSPRVRAAGANGVEIEFTAGFAAGEMPENLKLALKRIVAAAYELRAEVPLAQQPGIVPPLARALLAPYRERRI